MYYPYFITYMLTGLAIALAVFAWALKNKQFSDQQRARFLPLEEEKPAAVANRRKARIELAVILSLTAAGVAGSFAAIVYAVFAH